MSRDPLTLAAEAQEVLDELWNNKLIPFPLSVGKITKAPSQYTLYFYDSRMNSADVPLTPGLSFRDMVRSAVIDRVEHLSGPLKDWKKE